MWPETGTRPIDISNHATSAASLNRMINLTIFGHFSRVQHQYLIMQLQIVLQMQKDFRMKLYLVLQYFHLRSGGDLQYNSHFHNGLRLR